MSKQNGKTESMVIDFEVLRRTAPVFAARKAFGLLSPGETLLDHYNDIINWERERAEELANEIQNKERNQLPIRDSKPPKGKKRR